MHLLVVQEDGRPTAHPWRALGEAGYAVDFVSDGEHGLERLLAHPYDAAIIDFTLPDRSGLQVVEALRAEGSAVPILMLTARDGANDIVRAFDAGVDDYLTKPYSEDELIARVRALFRRGRAPSPASLEVGDLAVDRLKREVRIRGRAVRVTPKEFALLEFLLLNCGRVVTRSALLHRVWDAHLGPSSNVVDVHIGRLRSKLRRSDAHVSLETVRGAGYLIRDGGRAS